MMKEYYGLTRDLEVMRFTVENAIFPENPLTNEEYMGHLAIAYGNWDFGCASPQEELRKLAEKENINSGLPSNEIVVKLQYSHAIKPVYVYEHGNISLSTNDFSDPFDSGLAGFIYMTPDEMEKNHLTQKEALECLDSSIKILSLYYGGFVYDVLPETLRHSEIALFNKSVNKEWEDWGYIQLIGYPDEVLQNVLKYFDIIASYDSLDEVAKDFAKRSHVKLQKVKVTKTLTQELTVFAAPEDAKAALTDVSFNYNNFVENV